MDCCWDCWQGSPSTMPWLTSRDNRRLIAAGFCLQLTCVCAVCFPAWSPCAAQSPEANQQHPDWRVVSTDLVTQVEPSTVTEQRSEIQRFRLTNPGPPEVVRFEARLQPSLLHYDYQASIQLRASAPGLAAGLIIMLPRQ